VEANSTEGSRWGAPGGHSTSLEIRQHDEHDGGLRVSLVGEVDLAVSEALTCELRELEGARGPVRLDLARLRFIDAAGLGALVRAITRARAAGCDVEVGRVVTPAVERVVALSGIAPVLWPD
jgi:anti-anti-sigma factor